MAVPVPAPTQGAHPQGLRRLRGPLAAAAGLAIAASALHLRDPHQSGSWGLCPLKAATGWDCPGCGGLRAVNDLTNGRILDAAHSNLLLVATVPVLVALWFLWVRRSWSGAAAPASAGQRRARRLALVGLGLVAVVFTVVRNTAWGSAFYAA